MDKQKNLTPNLRKRNNAYINFVRQWKENNNTENMNGASILKEVSSQWKKLILKEVSSQWQKLSKDEKDLYTPLNPKTVKEIYEDFLTQNPEAHWSIYYYWDKENEVKNLYRKWKYFNTQQKKKFQQLMDSNYQSD